MSGGSMNYICWALENAAEGMMQDAELEELVHDFAEVLHDCEWYHSADICEETYRETVRKFKRKWIGGKGRNERLKAIIEKRIGEVREELMQMIGEGSGEDTNVTT